MDDPVEEDVDELPVEDEGQLFTPVTRPSLGAAKDAAKDAAKEAAKEANRQLKEAKRQLKEAAKKDS